MVVHNKFDDSAEACTISIYPRQTDVGPCSRELANFQACSYAEVHGRDVWSTEDEATYSCVARFRSA